MKLIVVADDDPDILSLVGNVLQSRGYQVLPARDGQHAWQLILREMPDLAILDVDMPFIGGFELLRRVRAHPHAKDMAIMLLSGRTEPSDKVSGFELGADDYVVKPFVPSELVARVAALLKRTEIVVRPAAAEEGPRGSVVGVMGVKGGVGTSALAANMAVSLAQTNKKVALVDLDLEHAMVSMLLDVAPGRHGTIVDLSREFAAGVDWNLMESFMVSHKSGLSVFPGPVSPAEAELVTGEHVKFYLGLLRGHFEQVILDLPTSFRDTTLDAIESCDRLLLVATPDLLSIKALRGMTEVLLKLGISDSLLQVVVNQVAQSGGLSLEEVKRGVGLPIVGSVPYGGDLFVKAVNEGTTVMEKRPQHPTSDAIKKLGKRVAEMNLEADLATRMVKRNQEAAPSWR